MDAISLYLIKFDIWYALFGKICFTNLKNDCKCTRRLYYDACGVVDFVICVMTKKRHELRSELLFLTRVNTSFWRRKRRLQFTIIPSPSSSLSLSCTSRHTHIHQNIQNSSEWRVKNWFNRILYFLFPFLNYKNPSRENK